MNEELEIIGEDVVTEAKRVWAKRGKKLKRMIRCTSGKKKGRTVSNVCLLYTSPSPRDS